MVSPSQLRQGHLYDENDRVAVLFNALNLVSLTFGSSRGGAKKGICESVATPVILPFALSKD